MAINNGRFGQLIAFLRHSLVSLIIMNMQEIMGHTILVNSKRPKNTLRNFIEKACLLVIIFYPAQAYRITVKYTVTGLLTGCAGAEPHNSVKPAQ